MPNASEMIAMLARQVERQENYALAKECETLEEFLEKLKVVIDSHKQQ